MAARFSIIYFHPDTFGYRCFLAKIENLIDSIKNQFSQEGEVQVSSSMTIDMHVKKKFRKILLTREFLLAIDMWIFPPNINVA